jgi:predicted ATPase
MLTKLIVRNFKRLRNAEIPLGQAAVFIGPNNSGKTTALQALALWDIGLRAWLAERGGKAPPEKRPGVAINRRDLLALPVPAAALLWNDLHVRASKDRQTRNIRIDIIVEGETSGKAWTCGLEFDYQSDEAFVCRPLRLPGYEENPINLSKFSEIPEALEKPEHRLRICFLPPMSGLAAVEPKVEQGRIDVLLGEGQTAQVLRNLCHTVFSTKPEAWKGICCEMEGLFGVKLREPEYLPHRGEIVMTYEERGKPLDVSCAGRGAQQVLLLLAYLHANPNAVLLLDEPDAHLEILRQRQIYNRLVALAASQGSQIVAASHSEVVLNEAAARDSVVAFVGRPHELTTGQSSQVLKSLRDIGFDQYYQAEQKGWVLYVEDTTDLPILREYARLLKHPSLPLLESPFVHYVTTNLPQKAREHFFGLREAKRDLVGIALFDRLDKPLQDHSDLIELAWTRREIENYICTREVLVRFAAHHESPDGPLFEHAAKPERVQAMEQEIAEMEKALGKLGRPSPWSADIKATDEFLDPLFANYSKRLGIPLCLRKNMYFTLVPLMQPNEIAPEVREKLDAIASMAARAKPVSE